ncbi:hypothetical protein ACQI4F_00985 [Mycolicibacterium vaccae]|uniref:hypothetical protein n=1 Tax=Mycolicibacterium vaccae TaxID=1810 RepID=UPI003CEA4806
MTDAVLQSLRLPELLAARIAASRDDDLAGSRDDDLAALVLGPRLHDVLAALGVPGRDWLVVARLVDADDREALGGYLDVLVADRCRLPGDDLVSDLIAHEHDGQGLTADEIRAILIDCLRAAAQ